MGEHHLPACTKTSFRKTSRANKTELPRHLGMRSRAPCAPRKTTVSPSLNSRVVGGRVVPSGRSTTTSVLWSGKRCAKRCCRCLRAHDMTCRSPIPIIGLDGSLPCHMCESGWEEAIRLQNPSDRESGGEDMAKIYPKPDTVAP
jgi:hypothetical protein